MRIIALIILCFTALQITSARAAEVVMSNGERFVTSHVWEEEGKIRFNMQGLVVTVNKEDVAEVIPKSGTALPQSEIAAIQGQPSAINQDMPPRHAVDPMAGTVLRKSLRESAAAKSGTGGAYAAARRTDAEKGIGTGIGMDGLSWRTSTKSLPGLEKIKTDPAFGGIDQYWIPGQPLKLGNAPLDGLVYGFWKDQLYSILMWADGRIGYGRLKDEIFARYGRGSQNKADVERFIWIEGKTQRMLEFDVKLKTGLFVMRSSELDAKIKEIQ